MATELVSYRITTTIPGDLPDRWAVPMPPPDALPSRVPWVLLYILRSGYYGGPTVTRDDLLRHDPPYPPATLAAAVAVLVAGGYLVPVGAGEVGT